MLSNLKYPILLVHGMGFRDYKLLGYWGRIPKILEQMGCKVFFGNQDSNADIETNAKHLAQRINQIIEETGAKKVNIIAHSKGGLDSRYAISVLGAGARVASLTTISTPHNGSKTVDVLLKFPKPLVKIGCFFTDCWFRILGDKKPATYRAINAFKTTEAAQFNQRVLDYKETYYQSYAFVMKKPSSDLFMWLTNLVVGKIEGENDGLLPPASVKWGEFKGVFTSVNNRGISHCDEIDMRRRAFAKKGDSGLLDIIDIYKDIVADLQDRGF